MSVSFKTCSACHRNPRRPGQRLCRDCHNGYARQHRRKHSELSDDARRKAVCRAYTNVLIRRGKILRRACEQCGSPQAQAHHSDYSDPRLVHWMCASCHRKHHRLNPPLSAPPEAPTKVRSPIRGRYGCSALASVALS